MSEPFYAPDESLNLSDWLFVARLTARTHGIDGVYRYSWIEQQPDFDDPAVGNAGYADAANPRQGDLDDGFALEVNNARVDVPTNVWLKQRQLLDGNVVYEFEALTPGAGCDSTTWAFATDGNGSVWEELGDDDVKVTWEDSCDSIDLCGGANCATQSGNALKTYCLDADTFGCIRLLGNVETQNLGFDAVAVYLNGALIASGAAIHSGGGCVMEGLDVSFPFTAFRGTNDFEVVQDTGDDLYHVGGFWEVTINWGVTC